jgi:hypothetical protein
MNGGKSGAKIIWVTKERGIQSQSRMHYVNDRDRKIKKKAGLKEKKRVMIINKETTQTLGPGYW